MIFFRFLLGTYLGLIRYIFGVVSVRNWGLIGTYLGLSRYMIGVYSVHDCRKFGTSLGLLTKNAFIKVFFPISVPKRKAIPTNLAWERNLLDQIWGRVVVYFFYSVHNWGCFSVQTWGLLYCIFQFIIVNFLYAIFYTQCTVLSVFRFKITYQILSKLPICRFN